MYICADRGQTPPYVVVVAVVFVAVVVTKPCPAHTLHALALTVLCAFFFFVVVAVVAVVVVFIIKHMHTKQHTKQHTLGNNSVKSVVFALAIFHLLI